MTRADKPAVPVRATAPNLLCVKYANVPALLPQIIGSHAANDAAADDDRVAILCHVVKKNLMLEFRTGTGRANRLRGANRH